MTVKKSLKNNHVFKKRSPNAFAHEVYQAYRCGTVNASWQGQQTSRVSWTLFSACSAGRMRCPKPNMTIGQCLHP